MFQGWGGDGASRHVHLITVSFKTQPIRQIVSCFKETHSPRDSLGDHEISHGEISHGHQENLLVNKFPFFTPFIDGVLQRGHFQHFKHTVDRWPTN